MRTPVSREGSKAPFALDDVREFAARNAAALRKAGHEDLAASLEAIDLEALYSDLEQLEQRLTAIEEKMIARLRPRPAKKLCLKRGARSIAS